MVYTRGGAVVMVYTRGVQCNGVPEGVQFNGVYQRGYSVMVYTSGGTV